MKDKIKKIPFSKSLIYFFKRIGYIKYFISDYNFYKKHFINSKTTINKIKYEILLIVHSLEKGMTNENPRPFGKRKSYDLMALIKKYYKYNTKECFEIKLSINILREYIKFYKNNNLTQNEEYEKTKKFLEEFSYIENLDIACKHIKKQDILTNFDYDNFLANRHSIRHFQGEKLKDKDIEKAINAAIKSPSACNRQMCKIYYIKNTKNKELIKNYGQGFGNFDLENVNLFLITFDMSSFYTIGERNQGWFNSGIIATNFINALHSLGIGSCMVQFANKKKEEEIIKKKLDISDSERIAVIIACGYYLDDNIVPASHRKNISEYYTIK